LELIKFKISTPNILSLLGMLKFLDLPFRSLVTLKNVYLPLSSHSDPANPAKQEHVYPAVILFFVASVHVPPF